mgnify:CR=1 FL=1|tara:strand:- start:3 stop:419 length:417 start_codon:yes stop_codon:yes gene_type:complete
MLIPKIISFKTTYAYHLSGAVVRLEWVVKNNILIVLKIGKKIKFLRKKSAADVFLYSNTKAKLYAVGAYSIKSKEIKIIIQNINEVTNRYKVLDCAYELNENIESSELTNMNLSITNTNLSLTNLDFKIKEINLKQTI